MEKSLYNESLEKAFMEVVNPYKNMWIVKK